MAPFSCTRTPHLKTCHLIPYHLYSSQCLPIVSETMGLPSKSTTQDYLAFQGNRLGLDQRPTRDHLLGNQITTKYDDHLSDDLLAYQKHNSCATSLIGLVEDWKLARDNPLLVGTLSTDMTKAYDSYIS